MSSEDIEDEESEVGSTHYSSSTEIRAKEVWKEAMDEWLERKWALVGRWGVRGFIAWAVVKVTQLYFILGGEPPHVK